MKKEKVNVVRVRRRFVDSALIDCGCAAGEDGAAFAEVVRSSIFDGVGSNEKARYLLLWNHLRGLALDGKVRISRDRNELRYYVNEDEREREKAEGAVSDRKSSHESRLFSA